MPVIETKIICPSCGSPGCSFYHDTDRHPKTPDDLACDHCGFEWQQSRGNWNPDEEAKEYRERLRTLEQLETLCDEGDRMKIEKTIAQLRNATLTMAVGVAATTAGGFASILWLLVAGSVVTGAMMLEFYLNLADLHRWVKDHKL